MADKHFTPRTPRLRSKITNGVRLLLASDGNSEWQRRYRDLCALHAGDLGGPEMLSEAQKQLIRRISALEILCEQWEAAMSDGKEVDLDLYNRTSGNLKRMYETIGLNRVAREINPIVEFLKGGKPE